MARSRGLVEGAARGGDALDRLGAIASTACAVHCALGALVPSALAAVGLGALLGTAIAVLSGAVLVVGHRLNLRASHRHHTCP